MCVHNWQISLSFAKRNHLSNDTYTIQYTYTVNLIYHSRNILLSTLYAIVYYDAIVLTCYKHLTERIITMLRRYVMRLCYCSMFN